MKKKLANFALASIICVAWAAHTNKCCSKSGSSESIPCVLPTGLSLYEKGSTMKMTQEHKDKIGSATKENWAKPEYRTKILMAVKGRILTKTTRDKISRSLTQKGLPCCSNCGKPLKDYRSKKCKTCFHKGNVGENNPNWKGGATQRNVAIRLRKDYQFWREAVYKRDNFTCVCCGKQENLQAHHILSFSKYPRMRIEVKNGTTLCQNCHEFLHGRPIFGLPLRKRMSGQRL